MANKIPLGKMLSALDKRDKDFYDNLSDDEKKDFSAWLCMRWASSTSSYSEHYLLMVNDFVNNNFSDFNKHPEMQWKLLSVVGCGKQVKHTWVAPPKKLKKNKLKEFIHSIYPIYSDEELDLYLKINTDDDIIDLAKEYGLDNKDIDQLLK